MLLLLVLLLHPLLLLLLPHFFSLWHGSQELEGRRRRRCSTAKEESLAHEGLDLLSDGRGLVLLSRPVVQELLQSFMQRP